MSSYGYIRYTWNVRIYALWTVNYDFKLGHYRTPRSLRFPRCWTFAST